MATLLAISDLHVNHAENRALVEQLGPGAEGDWLIVGGDVADSLEDIEWALALLAQRFAKVIWAPGNHELLSPREDAAEPRGVARYELLVGLCRRLGVITPEDPYPLWQGDGGPAVVAPLFLLYDYSFGAGLAPTRAEALRLAELAGVVCVDEFLLTPDPYPSREQWCRARVRETEARLEQLPAGVPTVIVNHFPLLEGPTRMLRHPEFAQWCGTTLSHDWHTRFGAVAVVYGHLHIPITSWYDGVRFEEVSLGYPREWQHRRWVEPGPRPILPPGPSVFPGGQRT
ncbi:MAG TPA: metallophosphoesterase [Solirubrobacterales bacterium]|jgi:3',5'-cyclic AMP phosphodiesterase CpdA|nr:metallophosphoesterase [Solirubrobacterales bacterium]